MPIIPIKVVLNIFFTVYVLNCFFQQQYVGKNIVCTYVVHFDSSPKH